MEGILNNQDSNGLASTISHYQFLEHNEKMNLIVAENEMVYAKMYNLIPFKDGDKWCVLLGTDLQTGIAGFGDTPLNAILDFNKKFTQK